MNAKNTNEEIPDQILNLLRIIKAMQSQSGAAYDLRFATESRTLELGGVALDMGLIEYSDEHSIGGELILSTNGENAVNK